MSDRPEIDDSATLSEAIAETITRYLAEHGGGMVDGFALAVNYVAADGEGGFMHLHHDGQTYARTLGMLRFHTLAAEAMVNSYLRGE